jgi:hypothetical protein
LHGLHFVFVRPSFRISRHPSCLCPIESALSNPINLVNPIPLLAPVATNLVTLYGVWIGNWIYSELAECNYKKLREFLWVIHSKTYFNYSTYKVFSVYPSRCSVVASIGGRSSSSGFKNYPRAQLQTSHSNSSKRLNFSTSLTH